MGVVQLLSVRGDPRARDGDGVNAAALGDPAAADFAHAKLDRPLTLTSKVDDAAGSAIKVAR
jgi:hypothetical protein